MADANQETTLGSAYSPVDYMSITSFPRLPEDDVTSGENTLKSRKDDDNVLSEQDTDPDLFLKSARLQRLPSSASDLAGHEVASLRETTVDPFTEDCACQRDGLTVIITACLTFATGVTVALIMQIYFGDPQVFNQGAVVTDVAQCTSLGFEVLGKQGSSVDAAIAAALCLGIVHPHTSGIGGGGVMLVHNIRKNETRVIDFRETAPSAIEENMLLANLDLKAGLLVGVPGMLSGMHQAHQLYGRIPWKDVVSMAADVARNGFNVTHDLGNYRLLSCQTPGNVSDEFRDLFLPNGQAPLSGQFTRRLDLADILDAVADKGISEFYNGKLAQDMVAAVRKTDFCLNVLMSFVLSSTYHWIAEAVKIALALSSGLGDPMFNNSVSEIVDKMLSKPEASQLREMINDSQAFSVNHYSSSFPMKDGAAAAQVMVMGPDDHIVSVVSSLNKPFGSRIVTSSGILLNSQILDFSWPNETLSSSPNPARKRPMSFLMPTAVRPAVGLCGTYVAVGSSNGEKALSGITQVLMNVLSLRKNMSDSLAYGRLHPQLEDNILLVDAEFLKDDVELLEAKGHNVEWRDVLSLVEGTRRTNDLIIGVKDPRSADASALTMSNMP
uniref:Glutathione hydrolase n=1 Tax=Poecilia latipinna TaxID=48699 RepID=A0A3B3U677_9TELE